MNIFYEDNKNEELQCEEKVNYVSKSVVTQENETDITFKGNEVINYSIVPEGVAKASINTLKGIVTFEKYDPDWCGEVTLNLETQQGDDSSQHYVHNFSINFESDDALDGFDLYNDVQSLDTNELETAGGAKATKHTHRFKIKNCKYIDSLNHYITRVCSICGTTQKVKSRHDFVITSFGRKCKTCGYAVRIRKHL